MKIVSVMIVMVVSFTACTTPTTPDSPKLSADATVTKTPEHMENLIAIVEIPTKDFSRAQAFYQAILDIKIEEMEMDGIKMGLFSGADERTAVQLIHGSEYKPSGDGTIVYLNGGNDLQKVVEKIEANGGKIIVPKTEIAPDMGFFAMFTDTEGNKLGLHSRN